MKTSKNMEKRELTALFWCFASAMLLATAISDFIYYPSNASAYKDGIIMVVSGILNIFSYLALKDKSNKKLKEVINHERI